MSTKFMNCYSSWCLSKFMNQNVERPVFVSSNYRDKCTISRLKFEELATVEQQSRVEDKLRRLVTEFKSLPAPIERVKRLLHYATILPPFDASNRVPGNRVTGCTTQVWLDVEMEDDNQSIMRFRADSDSEITKGFCSCLIWVLDGGEAAEVLAVKAEDLAEMNVGLPAGTSRSRINTWHNVLISMQKRTQDLFTGRDKKPPPSPPEPLAAALAAIAETMV